MIGGTLQAVFSVHLTRHSEAGQQLCTAWRDYKLHLQPVSRAGGPISLTSEGMGREVVAILLGQHRKHGNSRRLALVKVRTL